MKLYFMTGALPEFTEFNKTFQSDKAAMFYRKHWCSPPGKWKASFARNECIFSEREREVVILDDGVLVGIYVGITLFEIHCKTQYFFTPHFPFTPVDMISFANVQHFIMFYRKHWCSPPGKWKGSNAEHENYASSLRERESWPYWMMLSLLSNYLHWKVSIVQFSNDIYKRLSCLQQAKVNVGRPITRSWMVSTNVSLCIYIFRRSMKEGQLEDHGRLAPLSQSVVVVVVDHRIYLHFISDLWWL